MQENFGLIFRTLLFTTRICRLESQRSTFIIILPPERALCLEDHAEPMYGFQGYFCVFLAAIQRNSGQSPCARVATVRFVSAAVRGRNGSSGVGSDGWYGQQEASITWFDLFQPKFGPKNAKTYHITWRLWAFETSTFGITWCDHFWPNSRLKVAEGFHIRWRMLAAHMGKAGLCLKNGSGSCISAFGSWKNGCNGSRFPIPARFLLCCALIFFKESLLLQ